MPRHNNPNQRLVPSILYVGQFSQSLSIEHGIDQAKANGLLILKAAINSRGFG